MLRNLALNLSYNSEEHNLVTDFYVPCLSVANRYDRAVGYFTSNGLSLAAQGLAHLLSGGGKIRLIASPALTEDDISAINDGYRQKDEVLNKASRRNFSDIRDELIRDRLNALSWLISTGSLEIQLALRVDENGKLRRGMFHEKMGMFHDENDDSIAFSGSQNETSGGLIENFESFDVFCSWQDSERVTEKMRRFDRLWSNKTQGLDTIPYTDVADEILEKFRQKDKPIIDLAELSPCSQPTKISANAPEGITLRDYQNAAINNWLQNEGRGVFKMAPGTGKTITALALADRLRVGRRITAVVVVAPFKHLVSQWANEASKWNMEPILAFKSKRTWEPMINDALFTLRQRNEGFLCVIVTNKTFTDVLFQSLLEQFPKGTLLIADEVHNLGAQYLSASLPSFINLRLGLSATPERWFDDEGTAELVAYFGKVLEPQLTLKDALDQDVLVPYDYFPIPIELTDEERDEYISLSKDIARLWHRTKGEEESAPLTALLMKRSRLIASAKNKLVALEKLAGSLKNESHLLFYCGDGEVENLSTGEDERQIEAVTRLLGYKMGIDVAPFTFETPQEEREKLLKQLDSGDIKGLIAIRCLDEGVDIPSIRTAVILASSRNPRQFIQRRGRILRRAPGKRLARIYDMFVVPPESDEITDTDRSLLERELERLAEFCDSARNSAVAREAVFEIADRFDLVIT
jgi:DNA phosphorothioation system restriction enzyme